MHLILLTEDLDYALIFMVSIKNILGINLVITSFLLLTLMLILGIRILVWALDWLNITTVYSFKK